MELEPSTFPQSTKSPPRKSIHASQDGLDFCTTVAAIT